MWGCSESINIVYFKTTPNTLKHATNTQWVAVYHYYGYNYRYNKHSLTSLHFFLRPLSFLFLTCPNSLSENDFVIQSNSIFFYKITIFVKNMKQVCVLYLGGINRINLENILYEYHSTTHALQYQPSGTSIEIPDKYTSKQSVSQ